MSLDTADFDNWVDHPRFGRAPRVTGIEPEDPMAYRWIMPAEDRIPNTGIEADLDKQPPHTFPIPFYFDQKRICCDCGRQFIWFAEEQKYWLEELKFYIGTDCIRCVHCRQRRKGLPIADTDDAKLSNELANKARVASGDNALD